VTSVEARGPWSLNSGQTDIEDYKQQVRFRSIASFWSLADEFRSSPGSGHHYWRSACPRQTARLFDHLVGAVEQWKRHIEVDRLGGLEIDDKLEFYRLLDR
jgi:hypothetical protein